MDREEIEDAIANVEEHIKFAIRRTLQTVGAEHAHAEIALADLMDRRDELLAQLEAAHG